MEVIIIYTFANFLFTTRWGFQKKTNVQLPILIEVHVYDTGDFGN